MSDELNMEAVRARFEAWAIDWFGFDSPTRQGSGYLANEVNTAWLAWKESTARRTTPVSAPMGANGEAIPLPPLPEMDSLADIVYAQSTPDDWDADYRATWQKLQVAERNKMQWRTYALQVREAIAPYADRIHHLERELEQARAAFIGSENARKDAERARGTVQSIDTPEFTNLLLAYMRATNCAEGSIEDTYCALIAYIDGRTAGTAPEWQLIETAPKDGTNIILTDGKLVTCGNYINEPSSVREIRDMDGRYIDQVENEGYEGWMDLDGGIPATHWMPLPAAPTPLNGKEEANAN